MENEHESIFDQLERLRITAKSNIPPHEFLFSWNGIPCFPRGELVAVTGKAKSGKTYLNSLLMGACAGEGRLGLTRTRETPLRVVWIDTEQSEDSTHEILRDRIGALIGSEPDDTLFHVFNLRPVPWKERLLLVLSAVAICRPDLVIFDGIRDVVGDINNYEEAQSTIAQLLRLASEYRTCIVCVLHQNKAIEDKTLRGALGTELQNKSFETYECTKNTDTRIFSVKQIATRKYDMPNKIDFCLSSDGLPIPCASVDETTSSPASNDSSKFNPAYLLPNGKIDKSRLLQKVLTNGSLDWYTLRKQIMQSANIRSVQFADKIITEARDCAMLQSILINNRREYVYQPQMHLFDEVT